MYYILDCNNEIVGNKKGYRTFRGANQQAHSTRSKVCEELWRRHYAKRKENPGLRLVSIIIVEEVLA
jgi:hypothetical protein